MEELRHRQWWLLIGYGLIGAVIYLSLTSKPVIIDIGFDFADKINHFLAYATLMAWFGMIFQRVRPRFQWGLGFVAMGVMLEILQGLGGVRYFDYADMVANAIGVAIGAILVLTPLRYLLHRAERLWS